MERLETYSIFNDLANRPALELAERLSELSPLRNASVFLGSGRRRRDRDGGEDRAPVLARHRVGPSART